MDLAQRDGVAPQIPPERQTQTMGRGRGGDREPGAALHHDQRRAQLDRLRSDRLDGLVRIAVERQAEGIAEVCAGVGFAVEFSPELLHRQVGDARGSTHPVPQHVCAGVRDEQEIGRGPGEGGRPGADDASQPQLQRRPASQVRRMVQHQTGAVGGGVLLGGEQFVGGGLEERLGGDEVTVAAEVAQLGAEFAAHGRASRFASSCLRTTAAASGSPTGLMAEAGLVLSIEPSSTSAQVPAAELA